MDVVAHLLAPVAEDRVGLAGHRALHQVGEEAVQLRAGVLGAGQAAAAEADRRHVEVAAVLLHQQVGGRLRDAEQRVQWTRRSTSRCRCRRSSGGPRAARAASRAPPAAGGWACRRRPCWWRRRRTALGAVRARRLEQVQRAVRVDRRSRSAARGPPSRARAGRRCGSPARSAPPCSAKTRSTPSVSRMSTSSERNSVVALDQLARSRARSRPRGRRSGPACRSRGRSRPSRPRPDGGPTRSRSARRSR